MAIMFRIKYEAELQRSFCEDVTRSGDSITISQGDCIEQMFSKFKETRSAHDPINEEQLLG